MFGNTIGKRHKVAQKSIDMVEAKRICSLIFCIFTISRLYPNIGFKTFLPLKYLFPVKKKKKRVTYTSEFSLNPFFSK